MKKIDFEAHIAPDEYCLKQSGGATIPDKGPFGISVAHRIELMDQYEVQTQFVSCGGGLERMPVNDAVDVAKSANDEIYKMKQDYPGRFEGYATLIPQDVDASLKELERCHNELGFKAWNTHTNFGDMHIDDDQYFPLFEMASDLGMFIYLHPSNPTDERLNGYGILLNAGLGYHIDGCITLTRLICKGIFDRFPTLKLMLGHLGEAMPFMIDRMDSMARQAEANRVAGELNIGDAVNEHSMDYYFKNNIFVTNSGNFSAAAFHCTQERLGIDHIFYGTDFPIEKYEQTQIFLDSLHLSKSDQEQMYFKNAKRVFEI